MLRFLMFILVGSIEGLGIFILMFALFRYELKYYIKQIIAVNIAVGVMTYFLFHYGWDDYSPVLVFLVTLAFLYKLFRINVFYAAWMFFWSYCIMISIQALLIYISQSFGLFTLAQAREIDSLRYALQVVTTLFESLIAYLVIKNIFWFSFVPYEKDSFRSGKENLFTVFIILTSILVLWLVFQVHLLLGIVILLAVIGVVLVITIRRDRLND